MDSFDIDTNGISPIGEKPPDPPKSQAIDNNSDKRGIDKRSFSLSIGNEKDSDLTTSFDESDPWPDPKLQLSKQGENPWPEPKLQLSKQDDDPWPEPTVYGADDPWPDPGLTVLQEIDDQFDIFCDDAESTIIEMDVVKNNILLGQSSSNVELVQDDFAKDLFNLNSSIICCNEQARNLSIDINNFMN